MIKTTTTALIFSLAILATGTTKACDIDAARAAVQSAAINANDATTADSLDDAQIAASDAEHAAQSAAIFLSDCESNQF